MCVSLQGLRLGTLTEKVAMVLIKVLTNTDLFILKGAYTNFAGMCRKSRKHDYYKNAYKLANSFVTNFKQFESYSNNEIMSGAPNGK